MNIMKRTRAEVDIKIKLYQILKNKIKIIIIIIYNNQKIEDKKYIIIKILKIKFDIINK